MRGTCQFCRFPGRSRHSPREVGPRGYSKSPAWHQHQSGLGSKGYSAWLMFQSAADTAQEESVRESSFDIISWTGLIHTLTVKLLVFLTFPPHTNMNVADRLSHASVPSKLTEASIPFADKTLSLEFCQGKTTLKRVLFIGSQASSRITEENLKI